MSPVLCSLHQRVLCSLDCNCWMTWPSVLVLLGDPASISSRAADSSAGSNGCSMPSLSLWHIATGAGDGFSTLIQDHSLPAETEWSDLAIITMMYLPGSNTPTNSPVWGFSWAGSSSWCHPGITVRLDHWQIGDADWVFQKWSGTDILVVRVRSCRSIMQPNFFQKVCHKLGNSALCTSQAG